MCVIVVCKFTVKSAIAIYVKKIHPVYQNIRTECLSFSVVRNAMPFPFFQSWFHLLLFFSSNTLQQRYLESFMKKNHKKRLLQVILRNFVTSCNEWYLGELISLCAFTLKYASFTSVLVLPRGSMEGPSPGVARIPQVMTTSSDGKKGLSRMETTV